VFAFAFVATWIIAICIHRTIGLRASAEEEDKGLDLSEFVETAYLHAPEYSHDPEPVGSHDPAV
ncbi:MAG: ammonia channel protein, partial [Actinomycetes bacterium]